MFDVRPVTAWTLSLHYVFGCSLTHHRNRSEGFDGCIRYGAYGVCEAVTSSCDDMKNTSSGCHDKISSHRFLQLLSLLSVLSGALLSGCTGVAFSLVNTPSRFGDYHVTRDIHYGEGGSHQLDVYCPDNPGPDSPSARLRPLIIFLYGGRWNTGSRKQYRFVADALTSRGYVVVIPEYRLYPETLFPGFVDDVAQAVRWTHDHVRDFGADPQQIFIMGHSAGAHIAAMINFDEQFLHAVGGGPQWLRGFVGLAGPYDFLPLTDPMLKNIFGPELRYPVSQPINFVDGKEPPALLLHGRPDTVVRPRNSEHLAARIREHGGVVTEKYYDDMSHVDIISALSVYYRKRRPVLDDIDAFVRATVAKQ